MTVLQALLLGAVQGLSEFLPISSDGHLVVAGSLLGASGGRRALGFDVLLHGGSLLALLVVDNRRWRDLFMGCVRGNGSSLRFMGWVLVATLPAALFGFFLEDVVAGSLRSPTVTALGFLCTALVLVLGEMLGERVPKRGMDTWFAVWVGMAQAVAILPGVSRSGLTVSAGHALGLSRRDALDFSFIIAVPIIAGAVSKIMLDFVEGYVTFPPLSVSASGFTASFIVSIFAISFLRAFVSYRSLSWFALYLVPVALFFLFPLAR